MNFLSRCQKSRLDRLTLFLRGMVLPNNYSACIRNLPVLQADSGRVQIICLSNHNPHDRQQDGRFWCRDWNVTGNRVDSKTVECPESFRSCIVVLWFSAFTVPIDSTTNVFTNRQQCRREGTYRFASPYSISCSSCFVVALKLSVCTILRALERIR